MLGLILDASRSLHPDDVPDVTIEAAAIIGATDVVIYVVDHEQVTLRPLPSRTGATEPLDINSTLAGRAFRTQEVITGDAGDGRRIWTPIVDGTERVGILALTLPEVDAVAEARCRYLGSLLGEIIMSKSAFGDGLARAKRTQPMSLAAELRWGLLPPLSFENSDVAISGVLEPAYDVAGDCFDYAVNGQVAHLGIFDAMGHGLEASQIANLAVGCYTHNRRHDKDLAETFLAIDSVISEQFGEDKFVTCQLAVLSLDTGSLRWTNAGHPMPMLVRAGRVVGDLSCDPCPPLGIGAGGCEISTYSLEPGDSVLFVTDGVTEAPSPTGELFGRERLADLLERAAASKEPAAEMMRRLVHAVLEHVQGGLRDDATLVLLRWRPGAGPA